MSGARRSTAPGRRRRSRIDVTSVRWVLALGIGVVGFGATGTLAAWTDLTTVSGTTVATGTLAPPTGLGVSQSCVADPTPTLRSPNGTSFTSGTASGSLAITAPSAAATG